jgi:DNA-binding beta-propeller fold protein YncE
VSEVSRVNEREWTDAALPEIDTAPVFTVLAEVAVAHGAISGIAVSPDGLRLMVTHYGEHSFSVIDTANGAVTQNIIDIDEPYALATAATAETPAGPAYISSVSAAYDSILAVDVDACRVVATYPVAHSVTDLATSPDGRHVYASRSAAHGADVAIIDTTTGTQDAIGITATDGTTTECVRVSHDGSRLYVAANGPSNAQLVVIDTQQTRVHSVVEIGSPIRDIALSADGATAYVGSCGSDLGAVLDVIDTQTNAVAGTYKIGHVAGFLAQLTLSRDGERAYLVGDNAVTVLSTATHDVVGSIAIAAQPSCVIESPDGSRLYIADYAGAVTMLAIGSTTASVDSTKLFDAPTVPHQWALRGLLGLEPSLA